MPLTTNSVTPKINPLTINSAYHKFRRQSIQFFAEPKQTEPQKNRTNFEIFIHFTQ